MSDFDPANLHLDLSSEQALACLSLIQLIQDSLSPTDAALRFRAIRELIDEHEITTGEELVVALIAVVA